MSNRELKNKPLVEAIFEARWKISQDESGAPTGSDYSLLPGKIYEMMKRDYPEYQRLDAANVPEEMAYYVAQHRFRADKDKWPLIQLGPGVLTVNDTDNYKWEDFQSRVTTAVKHLQDAYSKPKPLQFEQIILRYVDAVEFDYLSDNALDFLKDKLKVSINMPNDFFAKAKVKHPQELLFRQSYEFSEPTGSLRTQFSTAKRLGKPVIIWETLFQASGDNVPESTQLENWLEGSHKLLSELFSKMIEGDLYRRFSNE